MATRGQFGTVGHPVLESTWPIPTPNEVDLYRLQSNLWRVCYPFEAIQRPILCWWQRTKRGGASKVWNLVSWYQQRRRCEGVLGEKRHYRGVPLRAGSATETLSDPSALSGHRVLDIFKVPLEPGSASPQILLLVSCSATVTWDKPNIPQLCSQAFPEGFTNYNTWGGGFFTSTYGWRYTFLDVRVRRKQQVPVQRETTHV